MSWAEIKKAVNSDISTPLNTLISNLIRDFKSQFEIGRRTFTFYAADNTTMGVIFDNLNMNTAIKADIRETKEAYILEADLPGMRKEDINLEYNQNYLTIHAHKNETKEDKKENYIRKERHYGEVSRSFYVGNIDKSAISAKFENGVLEVILPKQEKLINEDNKIKIE